MLKIGVTGGIGVGKTVVCRMFQLLGIPVYDSDARAKWVMHHNDALKQELIAAFGPETYNEQGQLDRVYVAKLAFNNPERLSQLNALVHPHVGTDFKQWSDAHAAAPYLIKEAAIMYESDAWKQMDRVVTVYAPLEVRVKRLLQRDPHRTEADIQGIVAKQLSEEEKIERADHVVYNNDQQLVIPQVLALHQQFLSLSSLQK